MLKKNIVYKFYRQVKQEVYKIAWLSKKELITSTIIVIVSVFVFSTVCLLLDYGIHNIIQVLLNVGK